MDQYIKSNVEKFDESCWTLVTESFKELFEKTTAYGLFDDTTDLVDKVKRLSAGGNTYKANRNAYKILMYLT